jgi:hypothetical protein
MLFRRSFPGLPAWAVKDTSPFREHERDLPRFLFIHLGMQNLRPGNFAENSGL